ncbi:MAG: phosphotransferase family protein [Halobacteriaceae archaeon]
MAVRNRLEAHFDSVEIGERLHAVPPHKVYAVRVDGRRAVSKVTTGPTGSAGVEGRVLAFVGRETTVPVPTILHCGEDYYVAAWHPDAPAPDDGQRVDEAWAAAAGRGLATLHAETAPHIEAYGRFQVRDGDLDVTGEETWQAAALEYLAARRSILAEYGHADVVDAVSDHLRAQPEYFVEPGGPVCCHGWATPDHVAVADGEVTCMLDFEHAIAAPAAFDYWRTVLPTFETEATEAAFRRGYEAVRSLPANLTAGRPGYGLLNLVYYFESLYVQDQHGPVETTDRAEALREAVFDRLD